MTIGERIRYCRNKKGITQNKLAELTGIHPVSIRKYETNKMQPQPAQLRRISDALGISYNALAGIDKTRFTLETEGDLMSLFMVLIKSNIIQLVGNRRSDGILEPSSVKIVINRSLHSYLGVTLPNETSPISLRELPLSITEPDFLNRLIAWEAICHEHADLNEFFAVATDSTAGQEVLAAEREEIELDLQSCLTYLNHIGDIHTKKPLPNYNGPEPTFLPVIPNPFKKNK